MWTDVAFSEAVQINPGVGLKRGAVYPFVDMASVDGGQRTVTADEEREFKGSGSRFQSGDTLMARITPCLENGKIARYQPSCDQQQAHGSTEFIVIRGQPGTTTDDFAYYLTRWEEVRQYAIGQMTGTSGRQRVPVDSLEHLTIPIPPLPEQRAIAHILGTLDDKIELNRQMNQTLEAMARTIFQDWFVDFGPVRAKLEGQDPYLPPELWDLFPEDLVDTELGEIPEGWEVRPLGKVVEVFGGTTPSTKTPEFWEGGIHCWATPKDLSQLTSPILLGTQRKVTEAGINKISSGVLPRGTLLLSSRAPIGYLAISEVPVAVNQGLIAMPPRNYPSNWYMMLWCRACHDEIMSHANGSTFLEINKSNFRQIPMIFPVEELLEAFDRLVETVYKKISTNQQESLTLTEQRNELLPKLLGGELQKEASGISSSDRT